MEKSLHEICVEAVETMIQERITRHVSYINAEDGLHIPLGVKVPKVTIEWVDAKEAVPEN